MVLDEQLMSALIKLQQTIKTDCDNYCVKDIKEFSCTRCSGSACRYVYDPILRENKNNFATNNKINIKRFSPSICITHRCNLSCVYCYQKHRDGKSMNRNTLSKVLDWIVSNKPKNTQGIELTFIGGEPMIEFDTMKYAYEYMCSNYPNEDVIFYATTNGTLLDEAGKSWIRKHKDRFYLRLSLDGTRETHNKNRNSSFDLIDIDFFKETWPGQGVKVTLSEYSLKNLAENIKFIHSIGFDDIGGVNLYEGDNFWDKPEFIDILKNQLKELVDFYIEYPQLRLNQLFDKRLDFCESTPKIKCKRCGIGENTIFFDVDGTRYPCTFITPMTYNSLELQRMSDFNFKSIDNFIDEGCYNSCYLYPICPTCAGANYMVNGSFKMRIKNRCQIQKLLALYVADLMGKRVIMNPKLLDDDIKYYTIESIKKIREKYYSLFF